MWRRLAVTIAQHVELMLPEALRTELRVRKGEDSLTTIATSKSQLVRRCQIAARFLTTRNRSILTGPSGGISEDLASADRDKSEGSGPKSEQSYVRVCVRVCVSGCVIRFHVLVLGSSLTVSLFEQRKQLK
jgi:hypothetical protein